MRFELTISCVTGKRIKPIFPTDQNYGGRQGFTISLLMKNTLTYNHQYYGSNGSRTPLFLGYEPSVINPFHSTAIKNMSKARFELAKFTHTIVNNLLFRSAFPIAYNTQNCGFYSFFTARSSSNDKLRRIYQTHFQPFHVLFHVGKTTVQACFVYLLRELNPCCRDENPMS